MELVYRVITDNGGHKKKNQGKYYCYHQSCIRTGWRDKQVDWYYTITKSKNKILMMALIIHHRIGVNMFS
jgi:hypothetical protein